MVGGIGITGCGGGTKAVEKERVSPVYIFDEFSAIHCDPLLVFSFTLVEQGDLRLRAGAATRVFPAFPEG